MRHRSEIERRGSYVVILDHESRSIEKLRDLAAYLCELSILNFEVIVVDESPPTFIDQNRRVLRWVSRYVPPTAHLDPIRAAIELASCEKVIVADGQVRYSESALDEVSMLLELHEVVEPQDYFDPLPWWGGIEAGRMLVHRSVASIPDHGVTFGFQKRAIRGLRALDHVGDPISRRLAAQGAEVFSAVRVFVRRVPPALSQWVRSLPRQAEQEFAIPTKAALFFMLVPIAISLALLAGPSVAGG